MSTYPVALLSGAAFTGDVSVDGDTTLSGHLSVPNIGVAISGSVTGSDISLDVGNAAGSNTVFFGRLSSTSNDNTKVVFRNRVDVVVLTIDPGAATMTMAGLILTAASTTTTAGLRLPHGAAPSSPTNGDIWTTSSGLYVRINGATVGPLS